MALWSTDLTTEDGALGAAQMGSLACLISAGFAGFYLLVIAGVTAGTQDNFASYMTWFFAAELIVFALAAFLLRSGKGAILAIISALFLALETFTKLIALALIPLVFDAILLILTVNGARGALALRKGIVNEEEIFS